jgi:hypothetical protein
MAQTKEMFPSAKKLEELRIMAVELTQRRPAPKSSAAGGASVRAFNKVGQRMLEILDRED